MTMQQGQTDQNIFKNSSVFFHKRRFAGLPYTEIWIDSSQPRSYFQKVTSPPTQKSKAFTAETSQA